MLPVSLLNTQVDIKRRTSTGRDSLNNPVYGAPTSGAGWNTVYQGVSVRLAFTSRLMRFAHEGERIEPTGTMYYNPGIDLQDEDRVLTSTGIEYTIVSVIPGYNFGGIVDHFEAVLALP